MVYLLSGISEIKVWATLYYEPTLKIWKGSIRSRNIDIKDIAAKYNGGGHKFAAGFKLKNPIIFKDVIADLKKISTK
jgi:phosphoesterase RecJ-like protein